MEGSSRLEEEHQHGGRALNWRRRISMEGEHWTGGGASVWRGALDWRRSIQHPVPRENILRWGRLRSSKGRGIWNGWDSRQRWYGGAMLFQAVEYAETQASVSIAFKGERAG